MFSKPIFMLLFQAKYKLIYLRVTPRLNLIINILVLVLKFLALIAEAFYVIEATSLRQALKHLPMMHL